MARDRIDRALLAKRGVEKDCKAEWEAWRYLLGGKMFAVSGGDGAKKPILTCKLPPADGLVLRERTKKKLSARTASFLCLFLILTPAT